MLIPRIGAQRVEAAHKPLVLRCGAAGASRNEAPAGMSREKSGTMPCGFVDAQS